jgi:DNA-binding MarR family transcriptional regulator
MQRTSTSPATSTSPLVGFDRTTLGARLEEDGDGRLFDPALRSRFTSEGMRRPRLSRTEAFGAVVVATKILQSILEQRLEPLGLTLQQSRALWIVRSWGGDGPHLRALAEQLHLTPRSVTAIVDGLEAQGLLERIPDPADRRAVTARLTTAGRERCETAIAIHGETIDELLGDIDDAELAQLRHLCYRLVLRTGTGQARAITPTPATTAKRS